MRKNEYNILRCDYTIETTEEYFLSTVREKYSQEHTRQIFAALDMARKAHEGKLRCNGESYIIHPMRVALMLLHFNKHTISKVFIAALLHDTVEKTSITSSMIEEKFGAYVAKLVQSVTRKHNEEQSPQEKSEAKHQNWLQIMSGSHEVRMIKVCEDLDNLICSKTIPDNAPGRQKISRWMSEAEEMSLQLARITDVEIYKVMQQEYQLYVESGFAHHALTE